MEFTPEQLEKIQEASKSPIHFAENLLLNPETGAPFTVNYIQKKFMGSTKKTVWFAVSRRCLTGETLVVNPVTLRPTPISELFEAQKVPTFDFTKNKVIWAKGCWSKTGKKDCIRFKLRTGVTLSLDSEHLLFDSRRGWVEAGDLRIGDRILAPNVIPLFGDKSIDESELNHLSLCSVLENDFPDDVFLLTKPALSLFLREFWNLNGRILEERKVCLFFTNKRKQALDLHHLLLRFEVESYIDEDNRVFITDLIDQSLFLNAINVECPIIDVKSPRRWEMILDIKRIGPRDVYDFSVVHKDHNFIANDLVVHNCGKSFGMVICALFHAIFEKNKKILVFAPSQTQINEIFDSIDLFLQTNPFLKALRAKNGNHKHPEQRRTFQSGSTIRGFPLGLHEGLEASRRGLTGDIIFIDEAQELQESDWTVLQPIIIGDESRWGKVKTYIAGTIVEPMGKFYDMMYHRPVGIEETDEIIFIPIDQNTDYTEERREQIRLELADEGKWQTEYLLRPFQADTAVFRKIDIDEARKGDWEYGIDNINYDLVRFVVADWDKMQAGSHIMVVQYDPQVGDMMVIDWEEVPRGDFTYTNACSKVIDYYQAYSPELVLCDQGSGETNWELLYLTSENMGLDLHEKLIKVRLGSKDIEARNPETGEMEGKKVKEFLVGLLRLKFQEGKIKIPNHDEKLANQFYMYKVKKQTANATTYSTQNEHLVDCMGFACYGIYLLFENFLNGGTGNPLKDVVQMTSAFDVEIEEKIPEDESPSFWSSIDLGERLPFYSEHIPRSMF